jgi:thiamine biosynthesis protein ThiS
MRDIFRQALFIFRIRYTSGVWVELVLDNEGREMEFSGTLAELLKELKVMREEVVVRVNGKLAPETRKIKPRDRIEVIRVVFGG